MDQIDYDDKKVLDSLGTGKTDGVFQLESAGMKSFMKELKPQSLEDIIAGISLYRPGPMDFIPQYIKGKNNPESITYDCPQLEPILEPTYGCIVYQEQVMQIVRESGRLHAGTKRPGAPCDEQEKGSLSWKRSGRISSMAIRRRACPAVSHNGIPEKTAKKIYDEMMDFAKYAFNKSHAACYAVVAYQTAYLKYYYPVEFMAALMTSVIDNPRKSGGIHSGLPPDGNRRFCRRISTRARAGIFGIGQNQSGTD